MQRNAMQCNKQRTYHPLDGTAKASGNTYEHDLMAIQAIQTTALGTTTRLEAPISADEPPERQHQRPPAPQMDQSLDHPTPSLTNNGSAAHPPPGGTDWPPATPAGSAHDEPSHVDRLAIIDWLQQPQIDPCLDPVSGSECSLRGQCSEGACFCYAGFSGPTCSQANCPNECSRRGECKLKQDSTLNQLASAHPQHAPHLLSFGFPTNQVAVQANGQGGFALCPRPIKPREMSNQSWAIDATLASPETFDNRLEWACACDSGFAGPDCGQVRELQCDNRQDDDQDSLVDCEDEDCCSLPVCAGNHMCFQSTEPAKALEMWRPTSEQEKQQHQQKLPLMPLNYSRQLRFYAQFRFMIDKPTAVNSYPVERAFDKARVSIIRGRVVKWSANRMTQQDQAERGIVSVRVGVAENLELGIALTREDGYFDMLVNGDEWITLQFNKNNYAPIRRRIHVKRNSFVLLEEGLEMWLTNNDNLQPQEAMAMTERSAHLDPAFNLQPSVDLHKFIWAFKRDDERKRSQLFDCMIQNLQSRATQRLPHEPLLLEDPLRDPNRKRSASRGPQLKTFVLASCGGRTVSLPELDKKKVSSGSSSSSSASSSSQDRPKLVYNSAHFPPSASVVKPTISIQLLGDDYQQQQQQQDEPSRDDTGGRLKAVLVQLDIEGQSRRERLAPSPRLIYQFAWNRRNVYHQKVYGFGELSLRIGYEYEPGDSRIRNLTSLWSDCLASVDGPNSVASQSQSSPDSAIDKLKSATFSTDSSSSSSSLKKLVWFEQKIYMEAHQLNQHADLAKWQLNKANRLDRDRELIYFGSGWSLPYKLAYPPILSDPIPLDATSSLQGEDLIKQAPQAGSLPASRTMSKGPNSSMFLLLHPQHAPLSASQLIQLDSTGKRRLLDVPLSILTNKLGLADQFVASAASNAPSSQQQQPRDKHDLIVDDIQILYNNYLSTLYLSSKLAGKMVQVSYSSLLALNKTLSSGAATAAAADDAIDIEPLCGFGRTTLSPSSPAEAIKPARLVRLTAPHSMTLDEDRQVLYFIDGPTNLMALDLISHRLSLLPVFGQSSQRRHAEPQPQPPTSGSECSRQAFCMPLQQYKMHRAHSLTWSKADSSLYFVDQNLILALRQDFHLELVAAGSPPAIRTATAAHWHTLVPNCFHNNNNVEPRLGTIKSLLADELNGDLLLVHQPDVEYRNDDDDKLPGRLYLVKIKIGRTAWAVDVGRKHWSPSKLIDLHSARQAWDPMIWRLSGDASKDLLQFNATVQSAANTAADGLRWSELANPMGKLVGGSSGQQHPTKAKPMMMMMREPSKRIPFIHLTGGFKRIDSIEINSDGSIFVLDSRTNSIKTISPYDPNEFNLLERSDVNINRLFAVNSLESSVVQQNHQADGSDQQQLQQQQHQIADLAPTEAGDESRKLSVLIVQNPITGELMEFHSDSGLQLSLTSTSGIKSELYYRILTNNKMVELDEDDKYDFDVQKTVLNYMTIGGNSKNHLILNQVTGAYVRLNKILDSVGNEYELVRLYTGSRFVLQSILFNHQPMCEIVVDYSGVLSTYQQSSKNYWIELVYDTSTYLLRDMFTKIDGAQSNLRQNS